MVKDSPIRAQTRSLGPLEGEAPVPEYPTPLYRDPESEVSGKSSHRSRQPSRPRSGFVACVNDPVREHSRRVTPKSPAQHLPLDTDSTSPSPCQHQLPFASYSPSIASRTPLTTPKTPNADIELSRSPPMRGRLNGRLNRNQAERLVTRINARIAELEKEVSPNSKTSKGLHTRPVSRSPRPCEGETKASEHGRLSPLLFKCDKIRHRIQSPACGSNVGETSTTSSWRQDSVRVDSDPKAVGLDQLARSGSVVTSSAVDSDIPTFDSRTSSPSLGLFFDIDSPSPHSPRNQLLKDTAASEIPAPVPSSSSSLVTLRFHSPEDNSIIKSLDLAKDHRIEIGRYISNRSTPAKDNGYFDSPVLNRWHAEICEKDGIIFVEDLGSIGGTYLRGTHLDPSVGRCHKLYELVSGDRLLFGSDILGEDGTIIHPQIAVSVTLVPVSPSPVQATMPPHCRFIHLWSTRYITSPPYRR